MSVQYFEEAVGGNLFYLGEFTAYVEDVAGLYCRVRIGKLLCYGFKEFMARSVAPSNLQNVQPIFVADVQVYDGFSYDVRFFINSQSEQIVGYAIFID